MNVEIQPHFATVERRLPFERVALVLQGGGALGAYQAGVYEALGDSGIQPNWISGMSIGAINAAIIAGNTEDARIDQLKRFWDQVTADAPWSWLDPAGFGLARSEGARHLLSRLSAAQALESGANGFFAARPIGPWMQPDGTIEATSFYDTGELKRTLERLVDFERINAGVTRLSVGAVNVRTGNFVYFDNTAHSIRPEHVMASAALPPSFPAVEIDGEYYWDGGVVSNTPLQLVVDDQPRGDTLAFQVDR
jgi:NTE family protein